MNACPNINGKEVRMRLRIGYLSTFVALVFIAYSIITNLGIWRLLVFLPAATASIVIFEVIEKTCVVYSVIGVKNMGEKYQKEDSLNALKIQRAKSLFIMIKGALLGVIITALTYVL
tara:strand:+ start:24603 stop:24953 length:351 start_codon:yes stop_codon:yes gene_type:complete